MLIADMAMHAPFRQAVMTWKTGNTQEPKSSAGWLDYVAPAPGQIPREAIERGGRTIA